MNFVTVEACALSGADGFWGCDKAICKDLVSSCEKQNIKSKNRIEIIKTMLNRAVSLRYVNVTSFLSFLVLIVWHQPVSFQNTSVPSGVFPSFRFPQALHAFVPLEQSQTLSLVSGPARPE